MARRTAFENLKPVKFVIGNELYELPAAEFARICACAVSGTKSSVEEKVAISKLTEEQLEAVKMIGRLAAQFGEKEGKPKKSTFTLTAEQKSEAEKYQAFMAPYEEAGKGAVGRYIYAGDAKTEEEALALIERNRLEYAAEKEAKKEAARMTPSKYREKPIKVMTDKGEREMPLIEFVRICPCNFKGTSGEEIERMLAWQSKKE
jgi:hypothetical protein